MNILISGSSGLIGGHLVDHLARAGHTPIRLVRRPVRDPDHEVRWTPRKGQIDKDGVARADAVIHLAGKSVASGRWNDQLKREIADSRIDSTALLAETLAELRGEDRGPTVLISASATGYYGDRGEEVLPENAPPGDGFLADVCIDWEQAADPARDAGLRVVHTRFGIVLAPDGGALKAMLPPFRMGLGGAVGSGRQWMPWVHIDDLIGALHFALDTEKLRGPVNVVSPNPVRNADFTNALGRTLNRPTILKVPSKALELALSYDMAHDTLLSSQQAVPEKLREAGYSFSYTHIEGALADLVK